MIQVPILETERLKLRDPQESDFAALAEFYASERSRFVGGPLTAERTWRALATEVGHWTLRGYGRWSLVEKSSGAFCGMVGPWNPEGWPEPEIGWDLMNGFEGKGYATEAARAALGYAFGTLNWPTAISLVADGNDGSAAVAQRLGARLDGRFSHELWGEMSVYRHPKPEAS